jgi:hypothetical protein
MGRDCYPGIYRECLCHRNTNVIFSKKNELISPTHMDRDNVPRIGDFTHVLTYAFSADK